MQNKIKRLKNWYKKIKQPKLIEGKKETIVLRVGPSENKMQENLENNTEFEEIIGTNTNTNVNTNINTNVNNNTTNTMPNTGVSYSSLVIIAIAAVSAVYAYKKIKEYNV